jgi:hypothetical protein
LQPPLDFPANNCPRVPSTMQGRDNLGAFK